MSLANAVGNVIATFARILTAPLGARRSAKALARLSAAVAPTISSPTPHGEIRFHCPNEECTRVPSRFLSWEPETLRWIDEMVEPDSCFWDIGAHIGSVGLYAGLKLRPGNGRVICFEPNAATFGVLYENIRINDLSQTVRAYCLAVGERHQVSEFHFSQVGVARDGNAFGVTQNAQGSFAPVFSQAMIGYSVDELIRDLKFPAPTHLKLDVDSIELEILKGARQALLSVTSVLLEIEPDRSPEWIVEVERILHDSGLRLVATAAPGRNKVYRRTPD